ncbi:sulfatase-like hydrolase/transferase [Luteolibacter sp. Populi]|uniref:sulfatase-like hydrolase/transferase n=1 Tax=Luteolibacter sp. Populi TaxID=3230487 RepID=UPI00346735C0
MRLLLLFAAFLGSCSALSAAGRPNILFVFADDWGRYAGVYHRNGKPGSPLSALNEFARTPVFDGLAAKGVLFRNAHVNAPSCTPCRSSLLSGQYLLADRSRRDPVGGKVGYCHSLVSAAVARFRV